VSAATRGRGRQVLGAFLRTPMGVVSALLLTVILVLAIVGPPLFGDEADAVEVLRANEGPSAAHPLGTNALGQDILARTLAATRLSLLLALGATGLAALLGSVAGALIASAGPRLRRFGAGLIDATLSFGGILLAIFVVAVLGVSALGATLAVALAFAPAFARFTYSLVVSVNARDYVVAARVVGVPRRGLLTRYVFPNVADSLAVATFTTIAESLIAVAALSFLGLGVQYPEYEWGALLAKGVQSFYVTPWAALAPAIMITLTGAAFSLFGDALARASNPLLWGERPRLLRSRRAARIEYAARPEGSS
jgi:ABC-type dipeptide/oligopeptide/nickel transport system permease subunit